MKRLLPWFHSYAPSEMHTIDAMFAKRPGAPELVLQDAQAHLGFEPGTAVVNISPVKFEFEPQMRDGKIKKVKKRDLYLRLSMPNVLNKKAIETAAVKGALDKFEFGAAAAGISFNVCHQTRDALRVELMEAVVGEDNVLGSAVLSLQRLPAGVPRAGVHMLATGSGGILGHLTLSLCAQGFGLPAGSDDDGGELESVHRRRLTRMLCHYDAQHTALADQMLSQCLPPAAMSSRDAMQRAWNENLAVLVKKFGPEPGTYSVKVTVVGCTELLKASRFDKGDPYVVLQIGRECVRTVTMKANPTPVFNATFNIDVYNPKVDVLSVTVMDEDVDDDDEMGCVQVCLQNLRMGQVRERTFPLIRHSGEAKAKFAGNIKLIMETTSFGADVVAGDGPREEAVVKRLLPWFHSYAPKPHLLLCVVNTNGLLRSINKPLAAILRSRNL